LQQGHIVLQEAASKISESVLRQSFLENLSSRHELLSLIQRKRQQLLGDRTDNFRGKQRIPMMAGSILASTAQDGVNARQQDIRGNGRNDIIIGA
jgi:hypothetical protein